MDTPEGLDLAANIWRQRLIGFGAGLATGVAGVSIIVASAIIPATDDTPRTCADCQAILEQCDDRQCFDERNGPP